MRKQVTSDILMIKPVNFRYNEETASNNYYQKVVDGLSAETAQIHALREFDGLVEKLKQKKIHVKVINDTTSPETPDAVFPNNWVSFHENGTVCLYPMFAESRRKERRMDIIKQMSAEYEISEIVDYTSYEDQQKYLEGTGSMVLDRANHVVYAAISERTDRDILEMFCKKYGYQQVIFKANQTVNGERVPIYHTNVMMCMAEQFALICLDTIDDENERKKVTGMFEKTGKDIITISEEQVNLFAGNMLQVCNAGGQRYMVMSSTAYHSLTKNQLETIEKSGPIIHSSLDTIEACGGGSARCMMAEIFLPFKQN